MSAAVTTAAVVIATCGAVRAIGSIRSVEDHVRRAMALGGPDSVAGLELHRTRSRWHGLRMVVGAHLLDRLPMSYRRWVDAALDRAGDWSPDGRTRHVGAVGCAIGVGLVLAPLAWLAGAGWVSVLLTIAALAWFDSRLHASGRRRQERLDAELPGLLDTLSVVLGSGANLGVALEHVVDASSGALRDELRRCLADTMFGVGLVESFAAVARRTGSPSLRRLSDVFAQSRQLGVPVAAATVALAAEMRVAAAHEGRRRAARLAPRISLVLSTVIVSGSLVLLLSAVAFGSHIDLSPLIGTS